MVSAASYPPLPKAQGRGTHGIETGKMENDSEKVGHPSQPMVLMKIFSWLRKEFYGPFGHVPYAISVLLIDSDVGEYLHRHLARIEGWPWGPAWTILPFYAPLLAYVTLCRFLDVGWTRWIAIPYSILTFSPYLLLFGGYTTNYWIPVAGAIVFQLPAILAKGKRRIEPRGRTHPS
jgi:hypothetical protein